MKTREIRFRAWDKAKGIMRNAVDIKSSVRGARACYATPNSFLIYYSEPQDEILMQFTGLKDKNGIDIYEGDIVKTVYGKVGEVVFHDERASFIMHDPDHFNVQLFNEYPIEVIGNIYENEKLQ